MMKIGMDAAAIAFRSIAMPAQIMIDTTDPKYSGADGCMRMRLIMRF